MLYFIEALCYNNFIIWLGTLRDEFYIMYGKYEGLIEGGICIGKT